jgi:hypothetical protein
VCVCAFACFRYGRFDEAADCFLELLSNMVSRGDFWGDPHFERFRESLGDFLPRLVMGFYPTLLGPKERGWSPLSDAVRPDEPSFATCLRVCHGVRTVGGEHGIRIDYRSATRLVELYLFHRDRPVRLGFRQPQRPAEVKPAHWATIIEAFARTHEVVASGYHVPFRFPDIELAVIDASEALIEARDAGEDVEDASKALEEVLKTPAVRQALKDMGSESPLGP